ncbi:acyltransferase family protein [Roseateles cavernae]|uniref:acyltransferase family protein n=1 Tax=Roseateles cavernae TaxID=3153578 RepID=UPI0032E39CB9
MKHRVTALEGLRGYAALLIVLYHLPKWHAALDWPLINNGHFMVELFFVLSGFVIYSAYGARITDVRALKRFQYLRFWRLYPVHLLFLLIYLLFECVRWASVTFLHVQNVRVVPFSENSLLALLQQLLLVQAIGPTGNAQTFNGPAWSISVEFYSYLVFALVSLATRRWLPLAMLGLLIGCMALLGFSTGFESLLTCVAGFALGCLTAVLSQRYGCSLPKWCGPVMLLSFFGYLQASAQPSLGLVFALAALLVFSIANSTGGVALGLLNAKVSLWLGSISYSLYMAHALVLWITAILFKRGFGLSETLRPDGKWVLDLNLWQALLASSVAVGTALLVAQLVYTRIEAPLRDWSRRRLGVSSLAEPAVSAARHG